MAVTNSAIGAYVIEIKAAFLAIFQPLVADLIAADMVCVNFWRDGAEILRFVDIQAARIRVIAKALRFCPHND